jgi:TrmH family RNA methyltransferase
MILSSKNSIFKKLKKIIKFKKYRDYFQEFVVFGKNSIQEALNKKIVKELFSISDKKSDKKKNIYIKKNLMKQLHPNKVLYPEIALCAMKQKKIISNKILVLDDIQDPGNVGNILRSACAFGFRHVFFSSRSADLYNEKVIRTSQGSFFNLFLEKGNIIEFLLNIKKKQYTIFSACVYEENIDLKKINYFFLKKNNKRVLVLGNEGIGISPSVKKISNYFLNINIENSVESLNVSSAGSILMYILK